jgi:hypothetical protein
MKLSFLTDAGLLRLQKCQGSIGASIMAKFSFNILYCSYSYLLLLFLAEFVGDQVVDSFSVRGKLCARS